MEKNGFEVKNFQESSFQYRFTDAEAMFNYYFFSLAFLGSWLKKAPSAVREEVFQEVSGILNTKNEIVRIVPFVCFDTTKA